MNKLYNDTFSGTIAVAFAILLTPCFCLIFYCWDAFFYSIFFNSPINFISSIFTLCLVIVIEYSVGKYLMFSNHILPYFNFLVLSIVINGIASASCTYLHVPNKALYDIGFNILPEISNSSPYYYFPDIITLFLTSVSILTFVFIDGPLKLNYCTKILRLTSLNYIFRAFSVVATGLPGPAVHCRADNWGQPFTSWGDILSHTGFWHGIAKNCGDLIYSGHTSITFIMIYAIISFVPKNKKVYAYIIGAFSIITVVFGLIADRKHYTIDCIIGLYMGYFLCHVFGDSIIPIGWQKAPKAEIDYRI